MGSFGAEQVSASIASSRQLGLDPGALFARFMQSATLAARLRKHSRRLGDFAAWNKW